MKRARLIGTGSYLPKKVLSNQDLEKMVDTSDEWIVTRTGMKERRIAAPDECTSDLGVKAAEAAIADAGIDPQTIDCIIVATLTPDYLFPGTACLVQKKLGLQNIPAFDIQAACSGYIYGLAIARAFVEASFFKNILLIASEKLSTIVDYEDRSTCVLFGDGAASAIISLEKKGLEITEVVLGADGSVSDLLLQPAGGSCLPASETTVKEKMHFIKMNGKELFKHAVRRMEQSCKECLEKAHMTEKDISYLIPHQANIRIIEAIAKRFTELPDDRIYKNGLRKYGNTSASSVGIALDELKRGKKFKKGENVLLTAFGAGLTFASAILTQN